MISNDGAAEVRSPADIRAAHTVLEYAKLTQLARALQQIGQKVVVTIGSYDLLHVGHCRYLEAAKSFGDVLIVGADTDRAVKDYKKDESRPMVPETERLEMLLHTTYVDFATLVDDVDSAGNWAYGLIKAVRPDVFVATEDSYPPEQLVDIEDFCERVVVLPRQAPTSTSDQIRRAVISHSKPVIAQMREMLDALEQGGGQR